MSLDASITDMALGQPGDEQLVVRFWYQPVEDKEATLREGRYVAKEVVYIEARAIGKVNSLFSRKATPRDLDRFKERYERWLSDQESPSEGTPIDEWPSITRAQAAEFKYRGINTVEDILLVSDSAAQSFLGFEHIRNLAKSFIEFGASEKAARELQEREDRIKDLESKLDELMKKVAAMDGSEKPKRKRRTKAEIEADKAKEEVTVEV